MELDQPRVNESAGDILVVEDEAHIARFLEYILQRQGFRVDIVHDGENAIRYIERGLYRAILLDLGLPGRSGMDVLRFIRSSDERRKTAVVVLTAKSSADVGQQVLSAGANAHCPKPVAPSTLLRILQEVGISPGVSASCEVHPQTVRLA